MINQNKFLGINSIDNNSPFFICPLFSYVVLKKIINLSHPGLFDEFEYPLGKEYANYLCKLQIKKNIKGPKGIKSALKEFENMGFGITKIVLFQQNKIILKNLNSSIAKQYSKSFFEDKIKVDHYLAGVYSGILSTHTNKNIDIEEKRCKAQGSVECVFSNTQKTFNTYNLNDSIKKAIKNHSFDNLKRIKYPHIFSEEMMQRGIYSNKDGVLKIANILHIISRFSFFNFSSNIFSKTSKELSTIFEYLGYVQGIIASKFQKNQFGRVKPDIIFDELLNHMNMAGYGTFSIIKRDDKKIMIEFSDATILEQSIKYAGELKDPFHEGVLLGFSKVYNKPVENLTMSRANKDKIGVSIIFGKNDLSDELKKKINSEEIKRITNDRMTHKYYLSPN